MIQPPSIQRKARNIIFTSSRFAKGLFAGYYRSLFRGPGIEIEEVRPYRTGDDVKHIDWNVTARTGAPYTKRYREERELPVFIVFDVSASMRFGTGEGTKREWGAVAAAALAYAAVYNSDRVGAVLFSEGAEKWIKPGRGTVQAARCVREFIEFIPSRRRSDINSVLRSLDSTTVRRGICFLVSDFKMTVDPFLIWRLKQRQDLVALRLIDPAESSPPDGMYIELRDLETDESSGLSGRTDSALSYRLQAEAFSRMGLDFFDLFTDRDPLQDLYKYFRRRARK